jgi:solute carrier family 8 (sodium/calcium exchanger)
VELEEDQAKKHQMIEFFVEQNDETWLGQFKKAIILTPSINEEDEIDYVTGSECAMHFASIGWKVFFAIVPPPNYKKGWVTFVVALSFIGLVTAIVGEAANLFGCALGMKQSITAITFVALGTSLPDTFASMTAAKEAEYADAAVGNVTGSNSVNVFLGLGLPWLIGTIYSKSNSDTGYYKVPAGPLGFSVLIFMICCVLCVGILLVRRRVSYCYFNMSLVRWGGARRHQDWEICLVLCLLLFMALLRGYVYPSGQWNHRVSYLII